MRAKEEERARLMAEIAWLLQAIHRRDEHFQDVSRGVYCTYHRPLDTAEEAGSERPSISKEGTEDIEENVSKPFWRPYLP